MALDYLVPPVAALFGAGLARGFGIAAWVLMAMPFQPTLRFYRLSPLWGFALPAHRRRLSRVHRRSRRSQSIRGKGGLWKGRFQAAEGEMTDGRPNSGPARAIGTRISRSPRC